MPNAHHSPPFAPVKAIDQQGVSTSVLSLNRRLSPPVAYHGLFTSLDLNRPSRYQYVSSTASCLLGPVALNIDPKFFTKDLRYFPFAVCAFCSAVYLAHKLL
mgnify:CR=1 FL=1